MSDLHHKPSLHVYNLRQIIVEEGRQRRGEGGGEKGQRGRRRGECLLDDARLHSAEKSRWPRSRRNGADGPRADDKKIEDFKLQGGSVIHLVLALRGGR